MASENKYESSSLKRSVMVYLKPRTYMMFMAERGALIRGKSEHAIHIIEKHYESMPESNQRNLIAQYAKMNTTNK